MSKALLRASKKLPARKNPYERAKEIGWITGYDVFYKPGHPAHREEHVFFGYSEHPSAHRDWVTIEVSETSTLHDASCRDIGAPDKWIGTAITLESIE